MYKAKDIAMYFLNKDTNGKIFNLELATYNDKTFYEGNCRLNNMLQISQNIYYAGTGKRLIKEEMYAYNNGGGIPEIQENYKELLKLKINYDVNISDEKLIKIFDEVYSSFGEHMHIADVIRISHQDPEWQRKNKFSEKELQKMELSNMSDGAYMAKMHNLAYMIGGYDVSRCWIR